jgi:iron complex outermembrane receptor protein
VTYGVNLMTAGLKRILVITDTRTSNRYISPTIHYLAPDINMKSKLVALISTILILSTTSLFANPILEELVVTASRKDQNISEISSNITKVSEIDAIGQTHINEAMQRVSGVWISRGNGQENLTAIRSPVLTGAGGCGAFLTAQDNIPLRASGFCNVNELFDANTEQASQIEVIKGPGSVVYGSNALHGTINVITPPVNNQTIIGVEAGPHDYYRLKATTGSDRWRLDLIGTTDGGYKHDSGFDQQKANFKVLGEALGYDLTTVISINNLNQETAGFIRGSEVYKNGHASRQNPNPEAFRNSRTARIYTKFAKVTDSGSEFIITPYARKTEMEFIQHFLPGQAIEENGQESIGIQSLWYNGNWVFGADAEFTTAYLEEFQSNPTQGSAFLAATIPAGDHYDYDVKAQTLAIFTQYTLDLSESTKLQFGGRLERVGYDYDNNLLNGRTKDDGTNCGFGGCRFSRPADRDDAFTNFSPRVGLTHFINPDNQFYMQLSRGFRAPQATELYRLQAGQIITDIDSEELKSMELGLRGDAGKFNYDLSIYSMRKDNFIFRDTNRATVDNGKTSHKGIELSLSHNIRDNLSLDWVASYALHRYENNPALSSSLLKGNDIDTAPRSTGSVRLNWIVTPKITSEAELVYMGSYFEDPENLHEYDGHSILNLRVKYAASENTIVFFRLMNMANTHYAERADFSFGSDRYFVGEPVSVYAGINVIL